VSFKDVFSLFYVLLLFLIVIWTGVFPYLDYDLNTDLVSKADFNAWIANMKMKFDH